MGQPLVSFDKLTIFTNVVRDKLSMNWPLAAGEASNETWNRLSHEDRDDRLSDGIGLSVWRPVSLSYSTQPNPTCSFKRIPARPTPVFVGSKSGSGFERHSVARS